VSAGLCAALTKAVAVPRRRAIRRALESVLMEVHHSVTYLI